MSSNPWINDEVPFEQYLTHARTKARAEARAEVDRLGPANAEQRAERKESPGRRALNVVLVIGVLVVAAVVIWATGVYVGAVKPAVWNHLPFVADSPCDLVDGPCRVLTPEEAARW